jgi:hypothetical protein
MTKAIGAPAAVSAHAAATFGVAAPERTAYNGDATAALGKRSGRRPKPVTNISARKALASPAKTGCRL